jgi:hypothetical protein
MQALSLLMRARRRQTMLAHLLLPLVTRVRRLDALTLVKVAAAVVAPASMPCNVR